MPNKRKKRNKRNSNKRNRGEGEPEPHQESRSARSDDIGPSDQSSEPPLEPVEPQLEAKHKIFLSHSGTDKDFTEQLCKDLERVHHFPFFDKRDDSLPKGEKFYPLIEEAAEQCRVAVLVLSDEFFTRSKWPMMECDMFVKARKEGNSSLKILPLFLGITIEQFKEKETQERWLGTWEVTASRDKRIIVKDWQDAFSEIRTANALEYSGKGEGHVAFREKVVAAVCKLLPPDVQWDVSHVQSMDLLSKPILQKMEKVEPSHKYGVRVVGLYGMGGVGKTTISKVICNQRFGDFNGKACHVELGGMITADLQRVLRDLTEASPEILDVPAGQLQDLLKKRMRQRKVFLVLDNVWDNQIGEARKYLDAGYHASSIVLVTARSLDILKDLGIGECDCLEMPELEEAGAIGVFLHYTERSRALPIKKDDMKIIKRCVNECCFLKGKRAGPSNKLERSYHYLPLALKVFGSQFTSVSHDILRWEKSLEILMADKVSKFKLLNDEIHPVFSVLRLGYNALDEEERHIFLDLAILLVPKWRSGEFVMHNLWDWLCKIHRKTDDDMKKSVNVLQRKGLLEKVREVDELEFSIHDLYVDFAEAEARAGPFEGRRFLVDRGGTDVPHELLKHPSGSCSPRLERLIIHNNKMQSLGKAKLQFCKNVEVLELHRCKGLVEVDVREMGSLRSMEVIGCEKLGDNGLEGVQSLSNLVFLRYREPGYIAPVPKFVHDLSSLTALRVLDVDGCVVSEAAMFLPNLSRCSNLQNLFLWGCEEVMDPHNPEYLPNLSLKRNFELLPKSLLKIGFASSTEFVGKSPISSMSLLTNLQDLNLAGCWEINDLAGLCELISLRKLDVSELPNISELPDLRKLEELQFLALQRCEKLTSLCCIAHAIALHHVDASWCKMLRELPDDLSGLKNLEVLDLRGDHALCTLPRDYERLARHNILKLQGCWSLIVPLLKELLGPERPHVDCLNSIGCVSRCEKSMLSCFDARKKARRGAYDLLQYAVIPARGIFYRSPHNSRWSYLMYDGEVDDLLSKAPFERHGDKEDILLRALCEHGDRGGFERLSSMIANVSCNFWGWSLFDDGPRWWVVVATAPCTFGVATKKAMLEPWNKTLLHYTLVIILPLFLRCRRFYRHMMQCPRDYEGRLMWDNMGIEAVLQKCKEKLEEARDQGIDPERCAQGQVVVDTILREVRAWNIPDVDIIPSPTRRCDILEDGILSQARNFFEQPRYCDLFPDFPEFGSTLNTQATTF